METRAHHVLIGVFTLLVFVAALGFALWLGKPGGDKQFDLYDIVFEEAVSGLSKGSNVEFNGIRIGDVGSLRLDPKDARRVIARVRVDHDAPVRSDTRARLVPVGITGIYMIRLSSGNDPASKPLRASGEVPVIVATPSPMSRLLADGEDAMLNMNELLVQARAVVSPQNVDKLGRTLQHLEQITATLAAQRGDLAVALQQLAQASAQANRALAEATRVLDSAGRLIDEQGAQTLQGSQRALAAVERTMQAVERLVVENRDDFDRGLQGLAQVGPAVAELRGTLASLRGITRQLEERPAAYLLGREPTREFQP